MSIKETYVLVKSILILLLPLCLMPFEAHSLMGIRTGDTPKNILLNDLNGKSVDVSAHFGKKPVILVFWELTTDKAFLNYSRDELNFLNKYYDRHHEKNGLEIYAIYTPLEDGHVSDGEISTVRNLIGTNKIRIPVLIDENFKFFRVYGVIALPSTIMIGREGRIDFIYPSFPVMAQQVFPEKIEKLVGIVDVSAKKKEEAKELGSRSNRLYHYSLQLYKRGLFEQALSPLRKSMELDDNYTWSHNLMGIILWRKGDLEGSIKEFQKAIRLDKKNSSAYLNYGLSLFYNKQYAEAENNIKSSISLMDRVAEAHYILGWIYKRTERMDDALQEMKRSLELFEEIKTSPVIYESSVFQRISVHNTLAQLYIESGDIQTALGLLQKGMQIALGIESKTDMDQLHRGKDLMLYE